MDGGPSAAAMRRTLLFLDRRAFLWDEKRNGRGDLVHLREIPLIDGQSHATSGVLVQERLTHGTFINVLTYGNVKGFLSNSTVTLSSST